MLMPMFPLGTVLFPAMPMRLQVFEPRYQRLVHDCLRSDEIFGTVLIERGSEVGGGDVRTSVGTMARIVDAAPWGHGQIALQVAGMQRIRVERWLPDDPYPRAEVEPWPEGPAPDDLAERTGALVADLRRVLSLSAELGDPVAPATFELSGDPGVAGLQASALAPLGPVDQHRLLAAPDPGTRIDMLAELLADYEAVLRFRMPD